MSKEELLAEIQRLKAKLDSANKRVKTTRYGMVWMDVPEAFEENGKSRVPVLSEVKENAIIHNDGKPTHLLIEGDNFHTLTCLQYSHKGLIDLIYIDPPYNTGSVEFTYRDKRVLEKYPDGTGVPRDHPLRHSRWLSFMSKRLKIAHSLLKDEGTMFISINEEEHAQLKLLCDSIFQESNYLTSFTVKIRHEDRILKGDKDFHETTEQLLLYRKSRKFKTIKRLQDNTSVADYVYEIEELTENPDKVRMGNKTVSVFQSDQYIIHKKNPSAGRLKKINIRGSIKEGNSSGRFYMAHIEPLKGNSGILYKVPGMGRDAIPYRYFLAPVSDYKQNGDYFQGVPLNKPDIKEVPYPNFLDFEEAFNNVGYEGGITFRNGKKPVEFLRFILRIGSSNKNAIILDFFAGSGSTGHAVLEQNSIDGGNRQVILCTNNENNIAREVTYLRMKNVMNGYRQTKSQKEILFELPLNPKNLKNNHAIMEAIGQFHPEKLRDRYDSIQEDVRKNKFIISGIIKKQKKISGFGNSLRYYKTDFIGQKNNVTVADKEKVAMAHKVGYLLALAENTLDETDNNFYYQIFENSKKATCIYFEVDPAGTGLFIKALEKIKKPVLLYLHGEICDHIHEDSLRGLPQYAVKPFPEPISTLYESIYSSKANDL